jgi:hypothetical protein
MSKIGSLTVAKETVIDVEYLDIPEFIVSVAYINREELVNIRNASLTFKYNKATRQREEQVDSDKFTEEYARRAIKGWRGLKIKHLPKLLPVDISALDPEEDVEFSEEEAVDLLKSSTVFDQFITDVIADYERFSITKKEGAVKN